jgi:hypothetical protein
MEARNLLDVLNYNTVRFAWMTALVSARRGHSTLEPSRRDRRFCGTAVEPGPTVGASGPSDYPGLGTRPARSEINA